MDAASECGDGRIAACANNNQNLNEGVNRNHLSGKEKSPYEREGIILSGLRRSSPQNHGPSLRDGGNEHGVLN